MNQPFEFTKNDKSPERLSTIAMKLCCSGENKAGKYVYNKFQQLFSGQTVPSSGEDHPSDDRMLTVFKSSFASDNGRRMRPLIVGWNRGGDDGLSVIDWIHNPRVNSHSSNHVYKNNPSYQCLERNRLINTKLSGTNQSKSCHSSIRLYGERPGNTIFRTKGCEKSLRRKRTQLAASTTPLTSNIVTLSVTGSNFTCGISLI